jgi:tetratricopeptide (TPR) repeat protein
MRSTTCSRIRKPAGTTAIFAGLIAAALAAAAIMSVDRSTGERAESRVWRPDSSAAVVLELDGRTAVPGSSFSFRRTPDEPIDDPETAMRYANSALQHYAITGDARFPGYAEGALRHWRNVDSPPPEIWILRGRILQIGHRFREAAMELERMLEVHGSSAEAMLLAADAWRRAGAIDKAKANCVRLALAGWPELARYCTVDVLLSLGNAEKALQLASMDAASGADGAAGVRQWELAVKADAAAAAGRLQTAESHYRSALALPDAAIALYVAYADLLLRDARPREALDTLNGLPDSDAVLLRRAMAARQLGDSRFGDYRERLLQSFSDAEVFGAGELHLRERAMFELHVENDAEAALLHATKNWEIQKGPEDTAILIEAAEAARQPDVPQVVAEWRQRFNAVRD